MTYFHINLDPTGKFKKQRFFFFLPILIPVIIMEFSVLFYQGFGVFFPLEWACLQAGNVD